MLFQVFHAYRKLVREGVKPPLLCDCGHEMVTMGKRDGDVYVPVLKCFWCGQVTVPTQAMYDSLRAQVTEFYYIPPEGQ